MKNEVISQLKSSTLGYVKTLMITMILLVIRVMFVSDTNEVIDFVVNYTCPIMNIFLLLKISKTPFNVKNNVIPISKIFIIISIFLFHPGTRYSLDSLFYISIIYLLFYYAMYSYIMQREFTYN